MMSQKKKEKKAAKVPLEEIRADSSAGGTKSHRKLMGVIAHFGDSVLERIKLCLLLWLGLFYTMKPLLSVRRDFSTRCREIRFGSSRIQSANLH